MLTFGTTLSSQRGMYQVVLAHHDHRCRHQQAADDGGVEYHRDSQSNPELLDRRVAVQQEAAEHEHHDAGGRGNHSGTGHESGDDRALIVVPGVHVLLDLTYEEHLVVH